MASEAAPAPRPWPRVKWTRAGQIAPLLGERAAMLPGDQSPAAAFAAVRVAHPDVATHLAAQSLPRIDAARWLAACLSWDERPTSPKPAAADKAVRRWVANPSDEARRLAYEAGEAAGFTTLPGLACLAIFLSGGSLAPAGQATPVNPAPGTFGQIVASAVLMAAYAQEPALFPQRIAAALDLADRIAAGETVP